MSYISLTASTNILFAPSEKSIILSQNKQEFKRKPLFRCSCFPLLTHLLLGLGALAHQSLILRGARWRVSSQAPALPMQKLGSDPAPEAPGHRGGRPPSAVRYPPTDHFQLLPVCFLEAASGHPGRRRTQQTCLLATRFGKN